MTDSAGVSPIVRFVRLITFVDLPIKRKFLLFFFGVLFWFAVMFAIGIATLVEIDNRSSAIVDSFVPHDRVTQKAIRKLQSIQLDVHEIAGAEDAKLILGKTAVAKTRIEDLKTFLTVLLIGGQVNDYSRDTGKLIDTIGVQPVTDEASKQYIAKITPLVEEIGVKLDAVADLKVKDVNGTAADGHGAGLTAAFRNINTQLSQARALAEGYAGTFQDEYRNNAARIGFAINCTTATSAIVLVLATVLLVLFTYWISRSLAGPINSIVDQIHSLGEGTADLSKRLTVSSKDEVGTLSAEFNGLMDSIHAMNTFKKVIEEDDTLEDVYSRLAAVFRESLGFEEFIIFEVRPNQSKMSTAYPLVLPEAAMYCNHDILAQSDLCRAKKTGHTVSSILFPGMCKQFKPECNREHVCMPMIIGGAPGGVAQFLFDKDIASGQNREERDRRLFTAEQYIKESLSVIEAKRLMNTLRESSVRDTLTGLYNRRFLQEYTDTLVAGTKRRKKNIGLVMCDLDYFKQVNDTYGHDVGDRILRETAGLIKKSVRESDLVLRFGGEEFLVLLMEIKEGEAMEIAEKIRKEVHDTKIKVPDGILQKTISLGVSEFPVDTQGFWQAIKYADVALYEAKEGGRNRAVRFQSDMWRDEEF